METSAIAVPGRPAVGSESDAALDAAAIRRGRQLARLEVEEIIGKVRAWSAEGRLNRGLRLSLPYYDDARGEMRWIELEIVPPGRILFSPAFVVLAARQQAGRVCRDEGLNPTTRQHLLELLRQLQLSFGPVPEEMAF